MVKQQERGFSDECFSDSIFVQNSEKSKTKRRCAILVTQLKLFIYDISRPDWKMIYKNQIEAISKVTVASESCAFVCLTFESQQILVLESFRRVELLAYLAAVRKRAGLKPFSVQVTKTIELNSQQSKESKESPTLQTKKSNQDSTLQTKDKKGDPTQSPKQQPKLADVPMLQEAIRNSKKSGFMRKIVKGGLFGGPKHHEYFFLLSDIGLVYFRKYGDDKSVGFMPLLGGTISVCPVKQFPGKDFIFCVKHHDQEKYLQCYSQLEMDDWIKHIKSIQDIAIGSKDTIREMKRVLS